MSEDQKKVEISVYDALDRLAEQQTKQGQLLDLLAKAIAELSDKLGKTGQGQQQGQGDFLTFLKSLVESDKPKKTSLQDIEKASAYVARIADITGHYRTPQLPYSGADKFLMRAGARSVYRMMYQGVKNRGEHEAGEEPSDEELDRMLGFTSEKEEEKPKEKGKHAAF